jgi:hypothetical protein
LNKSLLRTLAAVLCVTSLPVVASGCIVETRAYARPMRPACPGGIWIEGHYGRYGRWHPGHWRCPGVVEVVEVE